MEIKDYLDKNGIMVKWFAAQLGMSHAQLSNFMHGHSAMPTIYWERIVTVSRGEVTMKDLLEKNNKYYEDQGRLPGKEWGKLPNRKRKPGPGKNWRAPIKRAKPPVGHPDNSKLSKGKKTQQAK